VGFAARCRLLRGFLRCFPADGDLRWAFPVVASDTVGRTFVADGDILENPRSPRAALPYRRAGEPAAPRGGRDAITGATSQLGRLVVAKLKGKVPVVEIVALARSPAKAADLGVTVREADIAKPETLATALAGVDTLLLIRISAGR
jgi:hypothetical protein